MSYSNKLFGVAFCYYVFIYCEIVKVLSIFTEFPKIRVQEKESLSWTWLAGVSGHLAPDTVHYALCTLFPALTSLAATGIKLHRARREMFSDVRRKQKALVVWCVLVLYPQDLLQSNGLTARSAFWSICLDSVCKLALQKSVAEFSCDQMLQRSVN